MDAKQQLRAFIGVHQTSGWLVVLAVAGLILEIIVAIIALIFGGGDGKIFEELIPYLLLPTEGQVLLFRPWTIFTYPFFVPDMGFYMLIRVFFDLWILFIFGKIHQQLLGDTRTKRLVILTVPLVAILTVLSCSFLPVYPVPYVAGISTIMITLIISSITLVPDYPIQLFLFGRVKILWIGLVLLLLELSYTFVTPQGVAIIIAATLGFFHIILLRRGTDITELIWSYYQDKENKPRMKVKYGTKANEEYANTGKKISPDDIPQHVIDGILDKISAKGYESLTREEKELLFRASSQKDNDK